ncbi:MAG: bacillithiol biosynthesis deacetylase BshB1 [Myxococcales bacterium]|nr:bacillithiol biosynthesis deacetylase BshB1 [Myxococcales bacterium]
MSTDLLVIGPHPDDAELSCGGLLALASDRGQRTAIVDLTRGEAATNGTVSQRAVEAQAAAEVLGVSERRTLRLPDTRLDGRDPEHVDAVVEVIRQLRPSLLLGPMPLARHPDHVQAAEIVMRAHFLAGLVKHRPDLGAPHRAGRLVRYAQRVDAAASFVVDVSSVYDRKEASLAAYASQFAAGAPTVLNHPLGLAAFAARDLYWGASIGVTYGEPYVLQGPVPLSDPVQGLAGPSPVLVPPT